MSRSQGDSSDSDDPAAVVAQPLEQLQSSTSGADSASSLRLTNSPEPEYQITPSPDGAIVPFEIVVPVVDNPEDYEYLPGHFEADRVLAVHMQEPKLIVRLKSGESQPMTVNQLKSLKYGRIVLREFINFSSGSQSPDPLAMDLDDGDTGSRIHIGGDGAGDESDIDFSNARNRQRRVPSVSYSLFFRSDDKDEDQEEGSNTHRNGRSGQTKDYSFGTDQTSDEEDSEEPPTRRGQPRGPARGDRKQQRRESSEESYATTRGQRKSSRLQQTHRRSMRERLEDDEYSEREIEQPRQQRYSGAREQFRALPKNHEFRQSHCSSCAQCGNEDGIPGKGVFVFCQGCTASYHRACLGERSSRKHLVTKVDEGYFILQCSHCLGIKHQEHDLKPHLGHCSVCREPGPMSHPLRKALSSQAEQQMREANDGVDPITQIDMSRVNNVGNLLIRCFGPHGCKRAFHVQHLQNSSEEDYAALGPDHWQCHECTEYSFAPNPIHMVVAWRPKGSDANFPPSSAGSIPEIDKEYLIKWKERSYFQVKWVSGDWVYSRASSTTMIAFFKSPRSTNPAMTTAEAIPEENLRVDNVFNVEYFNEPQSQADRANPEMVRNAYVKFKGLSYEDSVWEIPPSKDDTARWEDFQAALIDWVRREDIRVPNLKDLQSRLASVRAMEFEKSVIHLNAQPEMVTGGELMGYQLDGVNWLLYMFFKERNAILADDMGLGKTVQVITLFSALIEKLECFPFLVVVPNSTVPNWRREIKKWTPEIRAVTYYGSAFARRMAIEHEMFHEDRTLCCHVVIASYESMADDEAKRALSKVHWAGLVVDEGQRLKNDKTNLYERLCRMKFDFKVLLTGTPLQNNIRELFNLLQFIDPKKKAEQLEVEYGGVLDKEAIRELHEMIRPCLLRRTKAMVLPHLPPMVQTIIPISMSIVQKKLYRSILEKNPQLINAICKKSTGHLKKAERHNLNNILIQLRKCLCHPFIYNRDIEERGSDASVAHRRLVEASGKLQLLNLMLPRLKERGHRVLIFSQFLENLDIVEDFLAGIGLRYRRLDGKLSSRDKQQQIDEFNAPDSPYFAFLLSTRSGGVGINLATADTVIIMDPDFNPQQDMQALSRAHRIGQENTVLVFHLVVRASVEEKIMQKGKKKMALDHVLIDRMKANEDEEDLESILKHGAQALFNDDNSADVVYDLPSIDKLLDRSQAEQAKVAGEKVSDSNERTEFNFARVWQKDRGTFEEVTETEDTTEDLTAWEQILEKREREAQEEAIRQAEGLGRGKRRRGAPNYSMAVAGWDDDEAPSPTGQPRTKIRKGADDLDADFTHPTDDPDATEPEPESYKHPAYDPDATETEPESYSMSPMSTTDVMSHLHPTSQQFGADRMPDIIITKLRQLESLIKVSANQLSQSAAGIESNIPLMVSSMLPGTDIMVHIHPVQQSDANLMRDMTITKLREVASQIRVSANQVSRMADIMSNVHPLLESPDADPIRNLIITDLRQLESQLTDLANQLIQGADELPGTTDDLMRDMIIVKLRQLVSEMRVLANQLSQGAERIERGMAHTTDTASLMGSMDTSGNTLPSTELTEELKVRAFHRVDSPPLPMAPFGTDGAQDPFLLCAACQNRHTPGNCPLRHAGVEFCGLCGLAHLGFRRVCPHLQSVPQVTRMMEALDKSTEAPGLVSAARRYLSGIISSTGLSVRRKAAPVAGIDSQSLPTSDSIRGDSNASVIDLTEVDDS
ncbi:Chromatin remodeling complex subunit (Chd3) [Penicillium bovifimosum]|uniref:Chromatin remodeling complex subunit (Chd3) n=1 Tax=Penicillium bovifimosum TaxID=126998 RepID=A0A9W9H4I2_9EURO|nr:Chromatin remodeling complex subunit (Chd3) [Penicillium bovifimosum]KAJ5138485.1 Chromatin remodeling complex subunit (Chd3) [Penicillium bovifimosum]